MTTYTYSYEVEWTDEDEARLQATIAAHDAALAAIVAKYRATHPEVA